MNIYDVIIIGSGPAGLFCALSIDIDKKIILLEKNSNPGKKLLISGSGQCNFTHSGDIEDFFDYYGDNFRFLRHSLYNFTNNDFIGFIKNKGIDSITNEEGKVFPISLKSSDILDVLINECEKNNVTMKFNTEVKDISYKDETFKVLYNNGSYLSKNLVIATGGMTYPVTGSTGDGYKFGKKLGHKIIKPKEALTPLIIDDYKLSELAGISFKNSTFSLWRNNKKIRSFSGDVLLTHKGISGPGILNNSRYMELDDVIKLSLINYNNIDTFRDNFIRGITTNGKMMMKTYLRNFQMPKRLISKILEISNINEELLCSQLNKKKRNNLFNLITEYPFIIKKFGGIHIAMATSGGISLKEVNYKTMESKKINGLYFVGEVLDIDGDTGGYNIQAAVSTGSVAANHINGKLK